MTKVKICGLTRPEDIAYVNEAKPDYAGFIVNFPKSRRSRNPDEVVKLSRGLDPEIVPVGVFVDESIETVAALVRSRAIRAVQLHGNEDTAYIAKLRELIGETPIIQAFRMRTEADVRAAGASEADLVLLDNGQGTGQTFNWSLAAQVRRPYLLAGGLGPGNIARAVEELHPWGVDISSGVETGGVKDREKILEAVREVRRSDR